MPVALVSCQLTYIYHCAHCARAMTETFRVAPGFHLRLPDPPPGWRQLPHGLVCPTHVIQYSVDGTLTLDDAQPPDLPF